MSTNTKNNTFATTATSRIRSSPLLSALALTHSDHRECHVLLPYAIQVLLQSRAETVIQSFLWKIVQRRRSQRVDSFISKNNNSDSDNDIDNKHKNDDCDQNIKEAKQERRTVNPIPRIPNHFLIQALNHPQLEIRRSAATLFLQATNSNDIHRLLSSKLNSTTTFSQQQESHTLLSKLTTKQQVFKLRLHLQKLIWTILQNDMQHFISSRGTVSHCGVVQLFGLLSYFVCDSYDAPYDHDSLIQQQQQQQLMTSSHHYNSEVGQDDAPVVTTCTKIHKESKKDVGSVEGGHSKAKSSIPSTYTTTGSKSSSPTTFEPNTTISPILTFVAQGGLKWITSSLLQLVSLLLELDGGSGVNSHLSSSTSSSSASTPSKSPYLDSLSGMKSENKFDEDDYYLNNDDTFTNQTVVLDNLTTIHNIQTRIVLLVDFCYRIVLFSQLHPTPTPKPSNNKCSKTQGDTALFSSVTFKNTASNTATSIPSMKSTTSIFGSMPSSSSSDPPKSSSSAAFREAVDAEAPIILSLIDQQRKMYRTKVLEQVHAFLLNSTIPCVYSTPTSLHSNHNHQQQQDSASVTATVNNKGNDTFNHCNNTTSSPLSPLACLIATHQVLSQTIPFLPLNVGLSPSSTVPSPSSLLRELSLSVGSAGGGGQGSSSDSLFTTNLLSSLNSHNCLNSRGGIIVDSSSTNATPATPSRHGMDIHCNYPLISSEDILSGLERALIQLDQLISVYSKVNVVYSPFPLPSPTISLSTDKKDDKSTKGKKEAGGGNGGSSVEDDSVKSKNGRFQKWKRDNNQAHLFSFTDDPNHPLHGSGGARETSHRKRPASSALDLSSVDTVNISNIINPSGSTQQSRKRSRTESTSNIQNNNTSHDSNILYSNREQSSRRVSSVAAKALLRAVTGTGNDTNTTNPSSRNAVSATNNTSTNNTNTQHTLEETSSNLTSRQGYFPDSSRFETAAEVMARSISDTISSLARNSGDRTSGRIIPAQEFRVGDSLESFLHNLEMKVAEDEDEYSHHLNHGPDMEDGECVDLENEDDNDDDDDDDEGENLDDDEDDDDEDDDDEMVEVIEDEDIDSEDEREEAEKVYLALGSDNNMLLEDVIVGDQDSSFNDAIILGDERMVPLGLTGSSHKSDLMKSDSGGVPPSGSQVEIGEDVPENRNRAFLRAIMEVLRAQYPSVANHSNSKSGYISNICVTPPILTPSGEQALIQSICDIVKPPQKPLKLKVFLRRAPTQEEFFRGSLSKNPIPLTSIKVSSGSSSDNEPRVLDLRQHIANDLQMGDSAELLELLVANKILDVNLKLRVVSQVLWKKHVLENSTTTTADSGSFLGSLFSSRHMINAGPGLSMVFGLGDRNDSDPSRRGRIDENTPVSMLPPMVVTYRLMGVDGEATEDQVEVGDLIDPDAPSMNNISASEYEIQMNKEFGITRTITQGRGVSVLFRSLESHLGGILRKIHRDDVGCITKRVGFDLVINKNPSRSSFMKSPPCPALTLLRYSSRLADNRKKLLKAHAPTILLRLLLDVLNAIDDTSRVKQRRISSAPSDFDDNDEVVEEAIASSESQEATETGRPHTNAKFAENNPTAVALQELIETLSNEISTAVSQNENVVVNLDLVDDDENDSESTLPILLTSLRTTSLSPPLRKVVAKLLPFLTYGQTLQSRALASHFIRNINIDYLESEKNDTLTDTFVDAAIHMPPVAVCNKLRVELISQGFISTIKYFILSDIPSDPPHWSPALFLKSSSEKDSAVSSESKIVNQTKWRLYFSRCGLQQAFRILIGLCAEHNETQLFLADLPPQVEENKSQDIPLLTACHWIESTSDNVTLDVSTNGLGILAETLLDSLLHNNDAVKEKVSSLRTQTRDRKKEIAQEIRAKALVGMNVGTVSSGVNEESGKNSAKQTNPIGSSEQSFGSVISAISNVFSVARRKEDLVTTSSSKSLTSSKNMKPEEITKPSWLLEMEAMEDERGLTCAVCQEGRTLQPQEMLGLYAYMKKVSTPSNKGGARLNIDGTLLLLALPATLPESLRGTEIDDDWYQPAKLASEAVKGTSQGASSLSTAISSSLLSRTTTFLTTVTAGNAIHCSCHARARTADRNHPKAPKSEWEGASLRNSRVSCNVILPLVSSKASSVPVMSVESSLADYHTAVSNMMGSRPSSMLWNVLHDIRLLLFRIIYGEALNVDCGGGSLSSNTSLIFYMLFMADMFAKDAEIDAPETVQHARELPSGFLAASAILRADNNRNSFLEESLSTSRLRLGSLEASPMAAICCILFYNTINDGCHIRFDSASSVTDKSPSPKRRWELYKEMFLCGFLQHAGRRHALGLTDSGCETTRSNISSIRRMRSSSFNAWDDLDDFSSSHHQVQGVAVSTTATTSSSKRRKGSSGINRSNSTSTALDEYANALRPFITLYALLDQLSQDFTPVMDDEMVEQSSSRLVQVIEACARAENIRGLLATAKTWNVIVSEEKILEEFKAGMKSVGREK